MEKHGNIGRYQLITRLATGGMAEVFLACERGVAGLERIVVIKRILPHLAEEPAFVRMFLREARIAARLNHPNVVQIFELGESDETYYIAMEYIHGSTSRELQLFARQDGRDIPPGAVISIVTQACRGLHAAHQLTDIEGTSLGLVHRDVSPQNLMVAADGHVKLLDFGVAKADQGVEATYSGGLKGKFAYMSPEQCRRKPLDQRSDIFSLSIILWELFTGERLFKRDSEMETMQAIVDSGADNPAKALQLPDPLPSLVARGLERNPEARFASAEEMRLALVAAAEKCGFPIGKDRVAEFIRELVGDRLAERRRALTDAIERSLATGEMQVLLPISGSHISIDELKEEPITVVERPSPAAAEAAVAKARAGDAAQLAETARAEADRAEIEAKADELIEKLDTPRTRAESETTTLEVPRTPLKRTWLDRAWLLGVGAVLVAALYFALWSDGPETGSGAHGQAGNEGLDGHVEGVPLRIGWPPYVDEDVLLSEMEPLDRYLEAALGRPVIFVVTESYNDCSDRLLEGELDYGVLPPLLYINTVAADDRVRLLTIKQFDGANSYDGLLVVKGDSQLYELADLRGMRFCLTEPGSTSGYFMPRHYIRSQGHDPDHFMGEVRWSGQHLQALRDLVADQCDVAATYNGALFSADDTGLLVGQLRVLRTTGTVPQDAVVAGPTVSESEGARMREVLLAFDPMRHAGVSRVGANQRVTGFSPAEDVAYDPLREALHAEHDL